MIKLQPGTVMPDEYDWEEQFSFESFIDPFIQMDVGKVRGLAIAYQEAQAKIKEIEAENERLKKWEEWAKSNVKYTLGIKNGMERAYDDCIDIVKRYVAPRMCETVASSLLVKLDCAKQQARKEKAT